MDKNKVYIIFNSKTRLPLFFVESLEFINTSHFNLYKEIEVEGNEINLARFKWDGDYDTGRFVDLFKEKKAVVTEQEIENKYYGMFFRKYSVEEALFNLIQTLYKTSSEFKEGVEMQEFLKALLEKKHKEIEMYKNSPNYIYETRQDQDKRMAESFKIS